MAISAEGTFPLVDLPLARRLERAEARTNAEFVQARARVFPDSGAGWIEVAGAYAMFDGMSSPCTQTFGLGLFDKVTAAELEKLETFFRQRGALVFHEVSPLADPALLPLLNERGYQPIEFTSVLFQPLGQTLPPRAPSNERIQVRVVGDDELELWGQTSARGWNLTGDVGEFVNGMWRLNPERPGTVAFLAELDGKAIAAGALCLAEGVGLLAGASTIPEGRRQGAQLALLDSRLRWAAEHGCDLAMMGAAPGSDSQRNAERNGFRIAYTRIKWALAGRTEGNAEGAGQPGPG
jgi:hypothetical protein